MNYDVDYFIDKFSKIDDEYWMTHRYNFRDQFCAMGHCGCVRCFEEGVLVVKTTSEGTALCNLFMRYLGMPVQHVNDGYIAEYRQSTPKARILSALYDIKAKQQPAPIKTKTVYVSVPITIVEQATELIEN